MSGRISTTWMKQHCIRREHQILLLPWNNLKGLSKTRVGILLSCVGMQMEVRRLLYGSLASIKTQDVLRTLFEIIWDVCIGGIVWLETILLLCRSGYYCFNRELVKGK